MNVHEPSSMPILATSTKPINPPLEFRDWQTTLTELKAIIDSFPAKQREGQIEFLPSLAWYALLIAAHRALSHLNDEHINCAVLWDPETGFPSQASIIADAEHYSSFADISPRAKALLQSFKEWTPFTKETLQCCCGSSSLKLRPVDMELMINHSVKREGNVLVITQRIGVRSNDMKHLRNHYSDFFEQSVRDTNLLIIHTAINTIWYSNRCGLKLIIGPLDTKSAKEFDPNVFRNEIVRLTQKDFNSAG